MGVSHEPTAAHQVICAPTRTGTAILTSIARSGIAVWKRLRSGRTMPMSSSAVSISPGRTKWRLKPSVVCSSPLSSNLGSRLSAANGSSLSQDPRDCRIACYWR
jgi:hypothetical protein